MCVCVCVCGVCVLCVVCVVCGVCCVWCVCVCVCGVVCVCVCVFGVCVWPVSEARHRAKATPYNTTTLVLQDVPFTVSLSTAVLSHRKLASAGIFHDSRCGQRQDKMDSLCLSVCLSVCLSSTKHNPRRTPTQLRFSLPPSRPLPLAPSQQTKSHLQPADGNFCGCKLPVRDNDIT